MNNKRIMEVITLRKQLLQKRIDMNEYPEDLETYEIQLNELEQLENHIKGVFEYDTYLSE